MLRAYYISGSTEVSSISQSPMAFNIPLALFGSLLWIGITSTVTRNNQSIQSASYDYIAWLPVFINKIFNSVSPYVFLQLNAYIEYINMF